MHTALIGPWSCLRQLHGNVTDALPIDQTQRRATCIYGEEAEHLQHAGTCLDDPITLYSCSSQLSGNHRPRFSSRASRSSCTNNLE